MIESTPMLNNMSSTQITAAQPLPTESRKPATPSFSSLIDVVIPDGIAPPNPLAAAVANEIAGTASPGPVLPAPPGEAAEVETLQADVEPDSSSSQLEVSAPPSPSLNTPESGDVAWVDPVGGSDLAPTQAMSNGAAGEGNMSSDPARTGTRSTAPVPHTALSSLGHEVEVFGSPLDSPTATPAAMPAPAAAEAIQLSLGASAPGAGEVSTPSQDLVRSVAATAANTGADESIPAASNPVSATASSSPSTSHRPTGDESFQPQMTPPLAPAPQQAPEVRADAVRTPPVLPQVQMPASPDDGFDHTLSSRLEWMVDQGVGHAKIRIAPVHLGAIDLVLRVDGDKVAAQFASQHADVRAAIEAGLPRLREHLAEYGLQLSQSSVSSQNDGSANNPSRSPYDGMLDSPEGTDGAGSPEAAAEPSMAQRSIGLVSEYV